jgi:hypothetical protein
MHMETNPSSSSHCAHGNHFEFKFTPIMGGIKKKAMIQCITSKNSVLLCCFKCIYTFINRNSKHPWSILHFSQLESIHIIGTNSQVKTNSKLFDFLQQANHRIFCDNFL